MQCIYNGMYTKFNTRAGVFILPPIDILLNGGHCAVFRAISKRVIVPDFAYFWLRALLLVGCFAPNTFTKHLVAPRQLQIKRALLFAQATHPRAAYLGV